MSQKSADGCDIKPGDQVYIMRFDERSFGPQACILDDDCAVILGCFLESKVFVHRCNAAKEMLPAAAEAIQAAERETRRCQREYDRLYNLVLNQVS